MRILKCIILFCCFLTVNLQSQEVEFNYNGRVNVSGSPFSGTGLFKFAIVNKDGDVSFWSNDSTSVAGSEPTSNILVNVTNGFFSTNIGSSDEGMDPLVASIFQENRKIFLRVWFSDGVNPFEQLNPDRRIINPNLIGTETKSDYTIYVDATGGNDENNGLTTGTAKQTIQAAVDILPARINSNITVKILPGIYREEIYIFGITVDPRNNLTFLGDDSWTTGSLGDPDVRITGTDNDSTFSLERNSALIVQKCSNFILKGILFNYTNQDSLLMEDCSSFEITQCKFASSGKNGIFGTNCSNLNVNHIIFINNTFNGAIFNNSALVTISDIDATNNRDGITIFASRALITGNCNLSSNSRNGIQASANSTLSLSDLIINASFNKDGFFITGDSVLTITLSASGTVNNNSDYGLNIRYNSYVVNASRLSYSGNGLGNTNTVFGGMIY